MSRTEKLFRCSPEDVFRVLGDGWSYAAWVVGASRIRDVDLTWPAKDSEIHHSVGSWPFLLDDTTTVADIDAPRSIKLRARAWPFGEAEVTLKCEPAGVGMTRVTMLEHSASGPARLLPQMLVDPVLHARNVESLRRLAYLAQRGGDESSRPSGEE
ncbi:MAG: SRPBCC family protein [Intrasporangium sp.]|uniref:SRPBCC family protein n=1 Tax=Intrasporangium sp. TaxID=1925024 RepID=UPI003F7E42DF